MKGSKPRTLDWKSILVGLAELNRENPHILQNNVLVGGAACMFYRDQLKRLNDPDFRLRAYSLEEEDIWLSCDADFATTEPAQMPDYAGDVPLGRLQMGFALGAEEFKENARNVRLQWGNTELNLLIADPLDLWREKEVAKARRGRPQDSLHWEVLGTTLEWEMGRYAEEVAAGRLSFNQWRNRSEEVRRRWNAILQNSRLIARLQALGVPEITRYIESHQ